MEDANIAMNVSPQPEIVADPLQDVAVNNTERKMVINQPGRQKHQIIYVHPSSSIKITNFDEVSDLEGWSPTITTTDEEKIYTSDLDEVLIVGVVVADQPSQYVLPPAPKSKERSDAKKTAPVVVRPDKVLRAVVRTTETVGKSTIYYVTGKPVDGIPSLRRITANKIFFFAEFVPNDWEELTVHAKVSALNLSCRTQAAQTKSGRPSSVGAQVEDSDET